MKSAGILVPLLFLMMVGAGCASSLNAGNALLPEGAEQAQVPSVDLGGYVFASASPLAAVSADRFGPGQVGEEPSSQEMPMVDVERATILIGTSADEIGGSLSFASQLDATAAWQLFQPRSQNGQVWGKLGSPQMYVVRGTSPWAKSVRAAFDSGQLARLSRQDPLAWKLITNLPQAPPSAPIAVGFLKLGDGLFDAFGDRVGIPLGGVGDAFGFVGVETVGFGVYTDLPIEVSETIDAEFLRQSQSGVLFVSHSSYPALLVSFILRVGAGRVGMDIVDLGDTNARYRAVGDMHLLIKNRGSLVFAAIAGERKHAEDLILSAISG